MAKVSFDTAINNEVVTTSNNGGSSDVGFLILKDDNDEAIVRFMYESIEDFDIQTVHTNIKAGPRMREVACIREPHDPLDKCPFCQQGMALQQKFFIRMTQYVVDNTTGKITPKPVIWERSLAYARTLKTYLENYGPLTNIMCKIVRHGKAGDQRTTYEIIPNLNPQMFNEVNYPKIPDIFGDYSVLGKILLDKNAAEMTTYLQTGNFPLNNSQNQATPRAAEPVVSVPPMNGQPAYNIPQTATPSYAAPANQQPTYTPAVTPNVAPQPTAPAYTQAPRQTLPWETPNSTANAGGFERPVRRY